MGRGKGLTDWQKEVMRTLYVKGMIPCSEIATRMGVTRQTVFQALRRMQVDTTKRKYAVKCSACGKDVIKTRAEVRKHQDHFCGLSCYKSWSIRPDIAQQRHREKVARDEIYIKEPYSTPGIFITSDNDILVFETRDKLLEWKRTGLPMQAFSTRKFHSVEVTYREDM